MSQRRRAVLSFAKGLATLSHVLAATHTQSHDERRMGGGFESLTCSLPMRVCCNNFTQLGAPVFTKPDDQKCQTAQCMLSLGLLMSAPVHGKCGADTPTEVV